MSEDILRTLEVISNSQIENDHALLRAIEVIAETLTALRNKVDRLEVQVNNILSNTTVQ